MSSMILKFLDKEYSIPNDILVYKEMLSFTDASVERLIKRFLYKVRDNINTIDEKFLVNEISNEVVHFIKKLCNYEIYNKTVNDYLRLNKGYELFCQINKQTSEYIYELYKVRNEAYREGVEHALQRKEDSVTGLDFGIISSSFVNHMIYASMNASKIKEQEASALKQYNEEINQLEKSVTEALNINIKNYIDTFYIPNAKLALTALLYGCLDSYISDLIEHACFDGKVLNYIDLKRSNDLLENLGLSSNKKAVLENAFLACPYNIEVYMKALHLDVLDYESFQVAKVFNISQFIIDYLKDNLGVVTYPNTFKINYKYISKYALYTECESLDILYSLTNDYAIEVYNAYVNVTNMIQDNRLCQKVLKGYGFESILHGGTLSKEVANRTVNRIVDKSYFEQLIDKCGHKDLFNNIKNLSPDYTVIDSKSELDKYLISKLDVCFENARISLIPYANQIKKDKETIKREEELARQKEEKAKKIKKVAIISTCCLLLLGIILAIAIPKWVESANISKREKFVENQIKNITITLEKEMEDASGIEVIIDYNYSLEHDWERELWYDWEFCVRLPLFEEYRKSNNHNEQTLLKIMDACKILEAIYDETLDEISITDFYYNDIRVVLDFYGSGSLSIRDLSTYETFYYEEYWGNRYLHSLNTEYVLEE